MRAKRTKPESRIGKTYGKRTVIDLAPRDKYGAARFIVRCVCGSEQVVDGNAIRGAAATCGCEGSRKTFGARTTTHGKRQTRTYKAWLSMKGRLRHDDDFHGRLYKARGITVCAEWKDSFETFYADMGDCPPGLTLERINNDLGYCKENCKWATQREQSRNKRNSVLTVQLAKEIKQNVADGVSVKRIAQSMGVGYAVVYDVVRGRSFKEVTP